MVCCRGVVCRVVSFGIVCVGVAIDVDSVEQDFLLVVWMIHRAKEEVVASCRELRLIEYCSSPCIYFICSEYWDVFIPGIG